MLNNIIFKDYLLNHTNSVEVIYAAAEIFKLNTCFSCGLV